MLLVTGGTGLLGQALLHVAAERGMQSRAAARHNAECVVDLTDANAMRRLVQMENPALLINCAAMTDLDACERDPSAAYLVNARVPGLLATCCAEVGARFIHISTDHFFTSDGASLHDEEAPVRLLNEYARSKYAGERLALTVPSALVIRTNVTGWRGWVGRPTFLEWAVAALERREAIIGYADFFTSTIDARGLAKAILDLAATNSAGLLNVAGHKAGDKATFLRELARALGTSADSIRDGSVKALATPRAESLGLDVRKAEAILGYRLPILSEVVAALVRSRPNH
jgi:dTDP-4-dehydrorhamnose reductase